MWATLSSSPLAPSRRATAPRIAGCGAGQGRRGSVSGFMPTPCIKLATNSKVYARMPGDMDINRGNLM
ncbi:MAG: hypothetical protein COC12_04745 [Rhodobacteraceae bacterium]|nr:MAG: hypothetical protein COC12_04745 [Paracoccaceae bacterium]